MDTFGYIWSAFGLFAAGLFTFAMTQPEAYRKWCIGIISLWGCALIGFIGADMGRQMAYLEMDKIPPGPSDLLTALLWAAFALCALSVVLWGIVVTIADTKDERRREAERATDRHPRVEDR